MHDIRWSSFHIDNIFQSIEKAVYINSTKKEGYTHVTIIKCECIERVAINLQPIHEIDAHIVLSQHRAMS